MLSLLRDRYTRIRRGSDANRYSYAQHVPSETALYDRTRICDFLAIDTYASAGLHLHGHEVKVSRGDWLTELRDPSKAEAWKSYVDRWWLVVSDVSIVGDDLPPGWGLMAVNASGVLRVVVPAPLLSPLPTPRGMLAGIMRSTEKTGARFSHHLG